MAVMPAFELPSGSTAPRPLGADVARHLLAKHSQALFIASSLSLTHFDLQVALLLCLLTKFKRF